jgi:hypothetical protein
MVLLHIEHEVRDFDEWKAAFDGDPIGRKKMGVVCYRVSRAADNPNYSIIDLEFGSQTEAQALLGAMQGVWARVGGTLIRDPRWHIAEIIETREV